MSDADQRDKNEPMRGAGMERPSGDKQTEGGDAVGLPAMIDPPGTGQVRRRPSHESSVTLLSTIDH